MNRTMIILCASAMAILASGCATGKLDIGASDDRPPASSTVQQPDDRPAADIQRENALLRARLEKLEKDYKDWTASIDSKKAEIDDLKRQRKEIEKDRDRWKKAAGKD
ncbi:MAG: hypothetical protein ACE15C_16745 [Phycisphaerae bacterium]